MEITVQNLFLAVLVLSALVLGLLIYVFVLKKRIATIFKSDKNASLDTIMEQHLARTERLEQEAKRHMDELSAIRKDFLRATQKVEITRYNSLGDAGAHQSFSLATLDGNRNGFILTYLSMRDTVRLLIKPVEDGKATQKLSEEEELTLTKAIQK